MSDPVAPLHAAARARWLVRIPLLAAALVICLANGYNLARLVLAEAPRNAWEATEVLEGWRSLRGMPVYELPSEGHSTLMYGALVPWVHGEVFRWFGPSNVAGRVLTLLSALATVTMLALTMRGDRSAWLLAVAWAMFLGLNRLSGEYFAENRPDMTSLLLSAMAVLLLGRGRESGRWPLSVLGAACMVAGFFFKQTAAIVAGVPVVVLMLRARRPRPGDVLSALAPMALMVAVIAALRVLRPEVYHYMIDVPGGYGLDRLRVVRVIWELLRDSPLFVVLLAEWVALDEGRLRDDPRLLWLVAVLAVTVPFSALSVAKAGGADNSKLPALLAMMSFCALRLPVALGRLEARASGMRPRLMFGTLLALLLLITEFPHLSRSHGLLAERAPVDRDYWRVVSLARRLPGRVVCPEDPTIPLYAKGYAGLSAVAEYDAHVVDRGWPRAHPQPVVAEIGRADYVVDVSGWPADVVQGDDLRNLGFEPLERSALVSEHYRIWRRQRTRESGG